MNSSTYTQRQLFKQKLFKIFGFSITFLGLAMLFWLIGKTFYDAAIHHEPGVRVPRLFDLDFYTHFSSVTKSGQMRAGILAGLTGSLKLFLITAIISIPLGVGAAVYLEEYGKRNRLAKIIEINISNLAGVPSILYGILTLTIFVRFFGMGQILFAGGISLALLILPIVVVASREAIKAVPSSVKDGAYGLGASKWQVIWTQILPSASGGIFTGIILAISRAIGETAPIIMVGAAMSLNAIPEIFGQFTALPMQIYGWASSPYPQADVNASAAIIVLLFVTFTLNGIAIYLRSKAQNKIY